MTDETYNAQMHAIDEIMKADLWDDGWAMLEQERRYSSPWHLANIVLGVFAWCAIGVLIWSALRP